MGRILAAVVWVASRVFVLWLFFGRESWVTGDIAYFEQSLRAVPDVGLGATLGEYPLPGVVLVAIPWLLALWLDHPGAYSEIVMGLALATDAAFTVLLQRFGRERGVSGLWVWLLAVPLLGATTYARFDLVPGILAGVSVLLLATYPRLAAVAATVATGLKLWPALLLPALAAPSRTRGAVVGVVGVGGAVLVVASFLVGGWERLVSPLTWQSDRGLQIESVPATPAMLAWALHPAAHSVEYSEYNAYEIYGPGVPWLLEATSLLSVLMVLGTGLLWVRAWRQGPAIRPEAVVWLCLAAVTAFMASSKVLSPQYLLWLLPLAAAGLTVAETREARRRLLQWSAVLLAATAATHLVFPVFYISLVGHTSTSLAVVVLLAVRNVMVVLLLVLAVVEAWRLTSRSPQPASASVEAARPRWNT